MTTQATWPDPAPEYDGPWPQTTAEFERLVDAYLNRLVRFAWRRIGNVEDAEDVVQGVLTSAFRDRTKRRGVTAVGPYLFRTVANGCTDVLRKRQLAAVFREEVEMESVLLGEGPSEQANASDEWRRAMELLARLPKEQAEAVRLRVFDELRLSEIAQLVGCSVNTVCSRLRYGFGRLRNMMAENKE
jgi:RNA polymerase sigma-70 factor (ECF subfamily)